MGTGLFITFEGPEGAGKTTIIQRVFKYLTVKGLSVVITREPGGIEIAEKIRSIILDKNHTMMDGRTEALLYAAARRQHLVEKIVPALTSGQIVLCDRFIDSSLAYQGYARGLGIDQVLQINQFAVDGWMPHLTFYFDVTPEIGLERINNSKGREINRLDLETMEFHYKVREGYIQLVERFPERIKTINAEQPEDDVYEDVKTIIKQLLMI